MLNSASLSKFVAEMAVGKGVPGTDYALSNWLTYCVAGVAAKPVAASSTPSKVPHANLLSRDFPPTAECKIIAIPFIEL